MEPPLSGPLPLCQFLEPGQVSLCVFDTARNSISDELKNKLDPLQRWIEAHQEERIELRLECFCVNDLVVALPMVRQIGEWTFFAVKFLEIPKHTLSCHRNEAVAQTRSKDKLELTS